ncbi:MAG: hypothetical protein FJ145_12045, partial [Deltaproteobacteria bacterium]|nr:hypothetical protein [Deltaproteobacteria bacterium]
MSEYQLIDALLTGKPYFGPVLRATQSPPVRHGYLEALVGTVARLKTMGPIKILEIGSWAGASAITWSKALEKLGRDGTVTCVDKWQPYFEEAIETGSHYRKMNQAARDGKIFNLFLHNIRAANVSHMVNHHVGDARDILPALPGSSYDIVYIDGSHAYEAVRADIREGKRLVRDGGIVCGDDLELKKTQVDPAEHLAALNLNKDFVESSKGAMHYHPGVTEAVAVEFGEVSSWEGVWAIRSLGSQWIGVEIDSRPIEIPCHVDSPDKLENSRAQIVGATDGFNLIQLNDRFFAAAKQLGPINLLVECVGERDLAPIIFIGESLDAVRSKVLAFERKTAVPHIELIEEFGCYNLVKADDRFLAVTKKLGRLELFSERLGERELPPILFVADSIDEVRKKTLVFEKQSSLPVQLQEGLAGSAAHVSAVAPESSSEPYLVATDYQGFNLVACNPKFFAVPMALGPVDFRDVDLRKRMIGEGSLLEAPTLDAARLAVDSLLHRQSLHGRLPDLENQPQGLVAGRKALEAQLTAVDVLVAELREKYSSLTEHQSNISLRISQLEKDTEARFIVDEATTHESRLEQTVLAEQQAKALAHVTQRQAEIEAYLAAQQASIERTVAHVGQRSEAGRKTLGAQLTAVDVLVAELREKYSSLTEHQSNISLRISQLEKDTEARFI